MKALLEDVKHALRLYRRTPGATLMVVAVLAIGMAFVASFLSLYSDLILRPEPGFERGGGRIVSVGWNDGRNAGGLPPALIDRIAAESTTLPHIAGVMPQQFRIGTDREQGFAELVTRQFFPELRPLLALGRGFSPEEHDAEGEPVVVISWRLWQERYGGRPDVLGQTIEIEGANPRPTGGAPGMQLEEQPRDFRIVGVMSRQFTGTLPGNMQDAWVQFWMPMERGIPVAMPVPAQFRATILRSMTARGIARLAPDVSEEAARSELTGRFADAEFMQRPGARYDVIDRIVQNVFTQRSTERQLQLFLGASVLLALVAAANVSLFLLARAPGRRRELGIRMAVGAPVRRLVRQLASEAAVLVFAGAALGLGLSIWLAEFLRGQPFLRQAQWRDVTLLDWRVLLLTGVFLLVLTLLVSLAPVAGLKRLGIAASSRLVTARPSFAQRIAGTAQVAVAGVLGGAAIAFTWFLAAALLSDPGYRTQNLHAARYSMVTQGTATRIEVRDGRPYIQGMVDSATKREALAAMPGVTAVSLAAAAPGVVVGVLPMTVPDPRDPEQAVRVQVVAIDEGYVDLLGLRLVDGQNIADTDANGALVNQTFAHMFFGRDKVAGEALPTMPWSVTSGAPPTHIAGVLSDLSYMHPLTAIDPAVFVTASGMQFSGIAILESTLPAGVLETQFQEVARELKLNPMGVVPLSKARSEVLAPDRARAYLTIGTAVLVTLLAAFGFYGTQRYLVTAGRREYAIRASLGAGPRALGRLVLQRGLLLGLPGLLLGAPLAFILVAWLRDDYISRDVSPLAVTAIVVVGLTLLLLIASLGPARLARRTQPAPLLRQD